MSRADTLAVRGRLDPRHHAGEQPRRKAASSDAAPARSRAAAKAEAAPVEREPRLRGGRSRYDRPKRSEVVEMSGRAAEGLSRAGELQAYKIAVEALRKIPHAAGRRLTAGEAREAVDQRFGAWVKQAGTALDAGATPAEVRESFLKLAPGSEAGDSPSLASRDLGGAVAAVAAVKQSTGGNSFLYDRARAFAAKYPKRDGGSWNQWCGSLAVRFGNLPDSAVRPTAIAAARASKIVSTDPSAAPIGAFHFWDIGAAGHVGVDLNGGGSTVFMASRNLAQSWGDALGVNSVAGYGRATGARYLGWSMDYAGGRIAGGGGSPVSGGSPSTGGIPRTSTEQDGIPGKIYYRRIQAVGRRDFGYAGAIDGVTGPNTEKARVKIVARELNARGGPRTAAVDDGIPGKIYWMRVQAEARKHYGYKGPIDGIPGPQTYKAEARICAYAVNRAL